MGAGLPGPACVRVRSPPAACLLLSSSVHTLSSSSQGRASGLPPPPQAPRPQAARAHTWAAGARLHIDGPSSGGTCPERVRMEGRAGGLWAASVPCKVQMTRSRPRAGRPSGLPLPCVCSGDPTNGPTRGASFSGNLASP